MDRVIPPEAVLAAKGIVKNNDLAGAVRILLQLRQEECQRQRARSAGVAASPRSTALWLMRI
jgi:hypothetical protein